MAKLTVIQAINSALMQEMERDENVLIMGEDVGVDGGVFRATEGIYAKFGAKRAIDSPLAEAGIVGTAIGMAIKGLRPVTEIQFSGFIYPAFQELVSHAGRIRNRSRGRYHCPLVVRAPYGGGFKALEHHSESTEAYFIHTPGLKVVMPSTPYDAKGLLVSAIRDNDPVIFFEPLRIYRAFKEEVPDELYTVPIGEAKIEKEGNDVTVISYGTWMHSTRQAVEELTQQGLSIELIDLRTVSPLDEDTIIKSVQKTGRCVIVHEAQKTCGLGAEISATIMEKCLFNIKGPVVRVTPPDVIPPLAKLEPYYQTSTARIQKGIKKAMEF